RRRTRRRSASKRRHSKRESCYDQASRSPDLRLGGVEDRSTGRREPAPAISFRSKLLLTHPRGRHRSAGYWIWEDRSAGTSRQRAVSPRLGLAAPAPGLRRARRAAATL